MTTFLSVPDEYDIHGDYDGNHGNYSPLDFIIGILIIMFISWSIKYVTIGISYIIYFLKIGIAYTINLLQKIYKL
ncbi:hypothetical protein AGMMS4957_19670 [Bacteroidia bacterium]|nr:hypothetical protein AGMMS4957_19670 [Bacteroidia bacterium]